MTNEKENKTGYAEALKLVTNTREEAREIYGELFKTFKDDALIALITQKLTLLEHLYDMNEQNNVNRKIDALVNIINYALFLLQNKIDEEKKHDAKHSEQRYN